MVNLCKQGTRCANGPYAVKPAFETFRDCPGTGDPGKYECINTALISNFLMHEEFCATFAS